MNTGLTTFDGYPRDDIDIAQSTSNRVLHHNPTDPYVVRTTRARIIPLRNDYKALMAKIEAGLHAHWESGGAATKDGAAQPSTASTGFSSTISSRPRPEAEDSVLPDAPFAKVNSVINGSPADDAGLQAGDEILKFGLVNFMNHEKLSKVAYTVQQNQGVRRHRASRCYVLIPYSV
jgi:26S proteasome non-ATPase regulatory subunit 9